MTKVYTLEEIGFHTTGASQMRGPGVKSAWRLAIEGLTPGHAVIIPAGEVPAGSIRGWQNQIPKITGFKYLARKHPKGWAFACFEPLAKEDG